MSFSIKIRTDEELKPFREQFKFKYKNGKIFVFDIKYNYAKAYSAEEQIKLALDNGKILLISKFVTWAWVVRFMYEHDIFEVQNAVARASLNGFKKTDIDAIARYI